MSIFDNLVVGKLYNIKVRARNIYGFGQFSDEADIRASSWPSKPEFPLTTTTVGTNVKVTFTSPTTNGDTITGYNILFKELDGDFSSASECDSSLTQDLIDPTL
jgi:hypothetical protein